MRQNVLVSVWNKLYPAHRIIWEMHYGPIPEGMHIDHRDGNPWNNRLENLRLATPSQNIMNASLSRSSKHGLKGVKMRKKKTCIRWEAYIKVDGKEIGLGTHLTKGLAAVARAKAAIRYHGEFARIA